MRRHGAHIDRLRLAVAKIGIRDGGERRDFVLDRGGRQQIVTVQKMDDVALRHAQAKIPGVRDVAIHLVDQPDLRAKGAQGGLQIVGGTIIDDQNLDRPPRLIHAALHRFDRGPRAITDRQENGHEWVEFFPVRSKTVAQHASVIAPPRDPPAIRFESVPGRSVDPRATAAPDRWNWAQADRPAAQAGAEEMATAPRQERWTTRS